MQRPTPWRLVALILTVLLSFGAVGDALGHPPCCTDECTSDFCPVRKARAEKTGRPSCHGDPAAATVTAGRAHGPAFAAPASRCAEDCATGVTAPAAASAAEAVSAPLPAAAAPASLEPLRHRGASPLPPASRGPPLS